MTQQPVNTHCPFSGKPVSEQALTTHQGQVIGFCNPGCRDKFAANPENYPQALARHFPTGRLNLFDAKSFESDKPWSHHHVATFDGMTSVKVHVSDQPYHWHENDAQEVFVVLDGVVEMRYHRCGEDYKSVLLHPGRIAHMEKGCTHVAHPQGTACMLVIERLGSE